MLTEPSQNAGGLFAGDEVKDLLTSEKSGYIFSRHVSARGRRGACPGCGDSQLRDLPYAAMERGQSRLHRPYQVCDEGADDNSSPRLIPATRKYAVFNVDQCELPIASGSPSAFATRHARLACRRALLATRGPRRSLLRPEPRFHLDGAPVRLRLTSSSS